MARCELRVNFELFSLLDALWWFVELMNERILKKGGPALCSARVTWSVFTYSEWPDANWDLFELFSLLDAFVLVVR